MRILIACQCATNKGDRAIAEYLLNYYIKNGVDVYLSTTRPDLWKDYKKRGVSIIGPGYKTLYGRFNNRFIKRVLYLFQKFIFDKILFFSLISTKKHRLCKFVSNRFIDITKQMDLVLVTGGHHITSIREKNALFAVTYDIGLISNYSKKYILWSQTIGPLHFSSKKAEIFIKNILTHAEALYVRDNNSYESLEHLNVPLENVFKTYDTVFGFSNYEHSTNKANKKLGISIFNGLKKSLRTFDMLSKVLDIYVKKGYDIEFFRMEYSEEEQDSINKIIKGIAEKDKIKIFPFLTTTAEHLKELSTCSLFIGYKTHSVILSLSSFVPLVAIAYHQKTIDFMKDYGLDDYAIDDVNATAANVLELLSKAENNRDDIVKIEKEKSFKLASQLERDLYETIKR